MSSEDTPEQAMLMTAVTAMLAGCRSTEWCGLCRFARVLFPVIHLLQELLGLFLVDKRQPGQAFFELEGVEKYSVLVVAPRVEDLLIPDNSPVPRLYPC